MPGADDVAVDGPVHAAAVRERAAAVAELLVVRAPDTALVLALPPAGGPPAAGERRTTELAAALRDALPGVEVAGSTGSTGPTAVRRHDAVVVDAVGAGDAARGLVALLARLRSEALAPDGTLVLCVSAATGPGVRAGLLRRTATYTETSVVDDHGARSCTSPQVGRVLERSGLVRVDERRVHRPDRAPALSATDEERIRGEMPELSDDETTGESVTSAAPAQTSGPRDETEWQQLFDSRELLRSRVDQLEREVSTLRELLAAERAHFGSELRLGASEVADMRAEIERTHESRVAIQKQLDKWQREYERLVSVDGKPLAAKVAYRRARRRAAEVVRSDPRLERAARRVLDRVRSR
ncbi:hypothetical protein INN71_05990 [Nocardioides sp. ChNu-153]|uniref:hypothetical protein n=1 Tax=unclassified Nocardioides TaxID=2615069 RepID=UPI0024050EFE|nr:MULTISPECIES: hypothetical protein [unclassified Nocardioides]MDF9718002.1 D52 family tumor protein [Nocardioides sp. ChNu-99]MDN7120937.1 hypothetical protein [Nocardioides sp. ChNu-153]